jgi:serine phosphatase RsbU (regulator of sigma subunit)
MEIGRRIQADFLPKSIPDLEGWEIASCFEAAREVAGDFYDVFILLTMRKEDIKIEDVDVRKIKKGNKNPFGDN